MELLKDWNRTDPSSCRGMRRDNIIEDLQGTRNRFIDHPRRVEGFSVLVAITALHHPTPRVPVRFG
jgi:hypothetical protein